MIRSAVICVAGIVLSAAFQSDYTIKLMLPDSFSYYAKNPIHYTASHSPYILGSTPVWQGVIFDVVAHEDDWQLFMDPSVYEDITLPAFKSVFIYTTAGDGGNKAGVNDHPFFRAREQGAISTVRFIADTVDLRRPSSQESTVSINAHNIKRVEYKNTVSYFLRLPDGGTRGQGLPKGTNAPSLFKFYTGKIKEMTSIDRSTTYTSRADLVKTLTAIVSREVADGGYSWFNLTDPDSRFNPDDHSDHVYTARFMEDVHKSFPCINMAYFQTYLTASLPINLNSREMMNEIAPFAVTANGVSSYGYESSWNVDHSIWLGRDYLRIVPSEHSGNSCFGK